MVILERQFGYAAFVELTEDERDRAVVLEFGRSRD